MSSNQVVSPDPGPRMRGSAEGKWRKISEQVDIGFAHNSQKLPIPHNVVGVVLTGSAEVVETRIAVS